MPFTEGLPNEGAQPVTVPQTDPVVPSINPDPLAAISQVLGIPNIVIKKPFNLTDFQGDLEKTRKEIMDKVESWETRMTTFFGEYEEYTDSWRVISRNLRSKPRGLFNSKSGETHRATETKASLWFRMLTAADPFFEAIGEGLDDFGRELTENDLYAVEVVTKKQLQTIRFKEKLLRWLRSLALFGSAIFEAPYVTFPYGPGRKYFEGTDMVHRSLLTTGFNPFIFDLHESDYLFTIDFPTIRMIRNWANNSPKDWDTKKVEEIFDGHRTFNQSGNANKTVTYNRVIQRKLRAGYNFLDTDVFELISYHGRIDVNNPAVQAYWESESRTDDPSYVDFTVGVLQGEGIVRFHATPFGSWHHLFKTAHDKLFEMEPLGYGVGKIGRKGQKETDQIYSRINDVLMFSLLNMWKVSKYAGLNVGQLTIKPWSFVELEDIKGLEPIRPQIEAIANGLNLLSDKREDFRSSTGATSNLQAVNTGATATESSIVQNEAMRGAGVQAEIIGEAIRDYLQTNHINNLHFMDSGMWVKYSGEQKPILINKNNLPPNIGFDMKITTDKDFRPERLQRLMEAIQTATSIRNVLPDSINVVKPLWEEWFRSVELNPRLMNKPQSVADQLIQSVQRANRLKQYPQLTGEVQGEAGGSPQGGDGGMNMSQAPTGPVPQSPVSGRPGNMSA